MKNRMGNKETESGLPTKSSITCKTFPSSGYRKICPCDFKHIYCPLQQCFILQRQVHSYPVVFLIQSLSNQCAFHSWNLSPLLNKLPDSSLNVLLGVLLPFALSTSSLYIFVVIVHQFPVSKPPQNVLINSLQQTTIFTTAFSYVQIHGRRF